MTVLEVLKFQVAYVPPVDEGSSHNVVQMSDEFNSDFDDDFAVHSLCSCGPGALVLPFMLVQTRSFVPCSLDSCGQGEFVDFVKQSGRGVPHNFHSKEL